MKQKSTTCPSFHNIFVKDNGDVYSFGMNTEGQCGTGNTDEVNVPTKIMNNPNIKTIVLGIKQSFYLENNGDLYACGKNKKGQLGILDNKTNLLVFTKVCSNVTQVATLEKNTIIQKDDGKIYWAGHWAGLGIESNGFTEILIDDVVSFSCGLDHCLFLKKNKEVWVMGHNEYGQCGFDDSIEKVAQPRLLMTDPNITSVVGGYMNFSYIFTKDENGDTLLKSFGNNAFGQTGEGTSQDIRTITSVQKISTVHCGGCHTFFLTEEGDVYGSGGNDKGQLGNGVKAMRVKKFTKVISDVSFITTGFNHSIFVKKNKEIFVCGKGENGQLGLIEKVNVNTPQKLEFGDLKLLQNY